MKLLLREIQDRYTQENFRRIEKELDGLTGSDTTVINNLLSNITSVESAAKLIIERTAAESIVTWDLIRLETSSSVSKATIDSYTNSKVIGIALNDGIIGEKIRILLFGVAEDVGFTFAINEPLFLQSDSSVGLTAPAASGEFITEVGQSLGSGSIFINVSNPIEIL